MDDVSRGLLTDLALLAIVVAHGTDADLDPRETTAVVEQMNGLAHEFGGAPSGADLSDVVEEAVRSYGDLQIRGLDEVVDRVRRSASPAALARAHAALMAVAEADEVVHTMERTFLRHLAQAWRLD